VAQALGVPEGAASEACAFWCAKGVLRRLGATSGEYVLLEHAEAPAMGV
jgi:hypothetical protein